MIISMKNKLSIFVLGLFFCLLFFFATPIFCLAEGDFDVTIDASRVSGVAPLSVFFDVTSTQVISDGSYIDSTCAWNFDTTNIDTNANYRTGSGFVAAHVYENPGTYNTKVDIYLPNGQHAWKEMTVTVSAFSGTTYYVAADGSDSNNGTSTNTPFKTVSYALTGSHVGPNTRILFKNGDTFMISKMVSVSGKTGPIIVDGYSDPNDPSSAKPIIYTTAVDSDWLTLQFSNCSDIRIMNIAARATAESSVNPRYPYGIGWNYGSRNMLKYRTEEYLNGGISISPVGQYNTIAECSFHETTQTGFAGSAYGTNTDNALIGNSVYNKNLVDDSNEEHVFRLQGGSRYYIANNTFGPNVIVNYDLLTIRGNTTKVVIYGNTIYDWVLGIWPQNRNSAEEYQDHCVIDSNLLIGSEHNGVAIGLHSKDIVIRNNIIYNYKMGISIANDTVVGASARIKVYNNTMINPNPIGTFQFASVDNECEGIELYNNLMYNVGGVTSGGTERFLYLEGVHTLNGVSNNNVLYGAGWSAETGLFDGLNLSAWQSSSGNDQKSYIVNPSLSSIDISTPGSAYFGRPTENSPLIGKGKYTAAALDFHGNLRDSARDIGAVEYTTITQNAGYIAAPKNLAINPNP